MVKSVGFIILRHVNSKFVDNYWKACYQCIRYYYPTNHIIIIDDNSDYALVDVKFEKTLTNTKIINSEYPKCGEVLPYYYYLSNKLFDIAVILHDSVFLNSKFDFSKYDNYSLLWEFEHHADHLEDEHRLLHTLNNSEELLTFHSDKSLWKGCFGGMCIITHDYLSLLDKKYNISLLLPHIKTRYNRMSFERVIACILQKNGKKQCLLGDILKYCPWGLPVKYIRQVRHLPIIKVWTGR